MPNSLSDVLAGDVAERLRTAVAGADNPVAAMRVLRRAVADLPADYHGQRDAIRWAAEQAMRPWWQGLTGDQGAKAAVWAALDSVFEIRGRTERADRRSAAPSGLAARMREALR